jgi:hypothetical protein
VSDGGADAATILERRRRAIGIAVSVLLVLVAIVLIAAGGDEGDDAEAVDPTPRLVDREQVAELEGSLGHPVYWAGERPPDRLELVHEPNGNVFLRYLPPGVEAGDSRAGFLTVGTYPFTDPVAGLERTAAEAGTSVRSGPGGATVLFNPSAPDSAYLAFPGTELQIEVYEPAGDPLEPIEAGEIEPAG